MRSSLRCIALAAMCGSALAVKGVIRDTIISDEQGCRSLCGLNNDCFTVLYDSNCHECWQLDCHLDKQPSGGLKATGKDTIDLPAPKCDGVTLPTKPTTCKNKSDGPTSSAAAGVGTSTSASTSASASAGSATTGSGGGTGTTSSAPSATSADDKKSAGWVASVPWRVGSLLAVAGLVAL